MLKMLKYQLKEEYRHYKWLYNFIRHRLGYVLLTVELYFLMVELMFILVLLMLFFIRYELEVALW